MEESMRKWLEASKRYEAAKKPGFKKRRKPKLAKELRLPSLREFMGSKDGESALALLKASEQYILLGESETVMSRSCSISLDGDGLQRCVQVTGMSSIYSKEKPTKEKVTAEEALENLRDFERDFSEEGMIASIYQYLDKLAATAP